MNDATIASDSPQWELGRLEHGFVRRMEHGWSVENPTEAIWYSKAAPRYQLDAPDEPGYRTQLGAATSHAKSADLVGSKNRNGRETSLLGGVGGSS
jgi:hypothetical protein